MTLQSWTGALLLACASTGAFACTGVEDSNALPGKLTATATSINYIERSNPFVSTLGTIKNTSSACAYKIYLEVKYFDGAGKQVDVATSLLDDLVVGPGQEVAFRARDAADKPREAYVSSTVRVVAAEPKYTPVPKEKESLWAYLFFNWGPMFALIGAYAWYMRKYLGKNSPQFQMLECMRQQTVLLGRQVEALERLTVAAEKRGADPDGESRG